MSTRRSLRTGGAHVSAGVNSALESMRRLKREGKRRLDDYEVKEEAPVYDEVDEEQYAQITAQKRKEAREFLVVEDEDGEDFDVVDDDLQAEFEYEDEESMIPREGDGNQTRKRRRRGPLRSKTGARRKSMSGLGEPKQRLPAAYHKIGAGADGTNNTAEVEDGNFFLDSLVQAEIEAMSTERKRSNHRRVRAVPQIEEMLRSGMSTAKLREALAVETFMPDAGEQEVLCENEYLDPPPLQKALEAKAPGKGQDPSIRQAAADESAKPCFKSPRNPKEEPLPVEIPTVDDPIPSPENFAGDCTEKTSMDVDAPSMPTGDRKLPAKTVNISTLQLEETKEEIALDASDSIFMYWTDAHGVQVDNGESLYLFGKVPLGSIESGRFSSICVQINGLERALYFLPRKHMLDDEGEATERQPHIIEDVHGEVTDLLFREARVSEVKAKVVSREYPFGDRRAPYDSTDYLKVKYPMKFPSISPATEGKSFSTVLGTRTSAVERFLVRRGIKGPCWLQVRNAVRFSDRLATTRYGFTVNNPKDISVSEKQRDPPHLSVLSINICTQLNPRNDVQELVMASATHMTHVPINSPLPNESVQHASTTFTVLCPPDRGSLPKGFSSSEMEMVPNEAVLLNFFLAKILRLDPDIIVGHELIGSITETLMGRMKARGTRDWSRLGRLVQRRDISSLLGYGKKQIGSFAAVADAIAGRLPCDSYLQAKELLPKEKDYSLTCLAQSQLGETLAPINVTQVRSMFNNAHQLSALVSRSEEHARMALRLVLQLSVLPLTKQLTNLSGNVWSRTLRGARAERIEFLLCHELSQLGATASKRVKYILPDKLRKADRASLNRTAPEQEASKKKKGPQYLGGLVLEPKRGLYDQFIVQLDFNSLYPSIIQEYNICFTTVRPEDGEAQVPDSSVIEGILPKVLRRLVGQRRAVKAEMQSERNMTVRKQLETRQVAIKLTANSLYGCLGFENSRFFAKPLAEMITAQGRATLQKTVELAQDRHMDVIYGDTDSLFVNTGLTDLSAVIAKGSDLKREVNRRYKTLEIEVDAVYAKMLLLRKKKYAAMRLQNLHSPDKLIREVKGLDLVRHDWSDISHDASEYALKQLLGSDSMVDDAVAKLLNFLTATADQIRNNEIPLGKYIITKSLTKMPEDYPDASNLPHVQVALRSKAFGKILRTGDYVKYVICRKLEGEGDSLAARAFHPEEVLASNGRLAVDVEWYLTNQVLPPISRLCEPIDGIETSHLAIAMGLDAKRYEMAEAAKDNEDSGQGLEQGVAGEDRFANCEEWRVKCESCGHMAAFTGIRAEGGRVVDWGLTCGQCKAFHTERDLRRQLQLQLRAWVKRYYLTPLQEKTDNGKIQLHRNPRLSNDGSAHRQWSSQWLYLQFLYMMWLLDSTRGQNTPDARKAEPTTSAGLIPTSTAVSLEAKKEDPAIRSVYNALNALAERAFSKNAYRYIDLSDMLRSLGVN